MSDLQWIFLKSNIMKITLWFAAITILLTFIYWKDLNCTTNAGPSTPETEKNKGKKDKKKDKQETAPASEVEIIKQWDLPEELKEVSGIAYLSKDRFACVQDEKGVIYIYNTGSGSIEKQIPFAGPGDYEGIAVNGNTAYVVTADGELYQVSLEGKTNVRQFKTSLTAEHNVEGLSFDKKNNRLLLAIKDYAPGITGYKGVYAFDLRTNTMVANPVMKIDMSHSLLKKQNKKKDQVMPSEIGIHPITNEIYVTDGPNSRLLILTESGETRQVLELGKSFSQPEGISFSPEGEIFISNEGAKGAGNIIKVAI